MLGLTVGVAGTAYVVLGQVQALLGLTAGIAIGFVGVVPSAYVVFTVFRRYPEAAEQHAGLYPPDASASPTVDDRHIHNLEIPAAAA